MSSKSKKQVRQPTKKIADQGSIRYGAGFAPASLVRRTSAETKDSGKVRFGAGFAPASLGK